MSNDKNREVVLRREQSYIYIYCNKEKRVIAIVTGIMALTYVHTNVDYSEINESISNKIVHQRLLPTANTSLQSFLDRCLFIKE